MKYIYHMNLRCKITYDLMTKYYILRIQKMFLFFWVNTNWRMTVSEGFWGEYSRGPNPMKIGYVYGAKHEAWKMGTLDLNKRSLEFIKEYLEDKEIDKRNVEKLK